VHGRTRNQFFKGRADWEAIGKVRKAISIPLIANGDGSTIDDVRAMLERSGADGVMIGRGAYGRPWWPGVLANDLDPGSGIIEPSLESQLELTQRHYDLMLDHYGESHGLRIARKHLGWAIARWHAAGVLSAENAATWRAHLMRLDSAAEVRQGLARMRHDFEAVAGLTRQADAA
jgi:tRNA-dihydrouridine synthase